MWENIAGAKRYSRLPPRGLNIAGASAPVAPAVPTPLIVALRPALRIEIRICIESLYIKTGPILRNFSGCTIS